MLVNKKYIYFFALNLICILVFLLIIERLDNRYILFVVYGYILISTLSLITKNKFSNIFNNFQISIFSLILIILALEFIAFSFPNQIPKSFSVHYTNKDISLLRRTMVQYLNVSPYVKFRPNTKIESQGKHRGNSNQFVYEWITDNNGFKNYLSLSKENNVNIVALGNSFTEGMGVKIENTWPSQLSAKGFSTYNLGVQGYSPTQLEGSFKQFGLSFNPKYVIIGYFTQSFKRENFFLDEKKLKERKFTGGIQAIANRDESNLSKINEEVRSQSRFISVSIGLFIYHNLLKSTQNQSIHSNKIEFKQNSRKNKILRYKNEVLEVYENLIEEEELNQNKYWIRTLECFDNIIELAKKNKSKVIVFHIPKRRGIYFAELAGKSLPENYLYNSESILLKKYSKKRNITYISPKNKLKNYLDTLNKEFLNYSDLPYLEIDGHMNKTGYRLLTESLLEVLKKDDL